LNLEGRYRYLGNQRIVDGSIYAGINPPALLIFILEQITHITTVLDTVWLCLKWETTEQYNIGIDFEIRRE
jgi:hypothetical protein